ncbi:flagellar protein FlgN [Terribacillus saccharophilus]|uniref:flagellar protein FlgN n=1 Tax=Terribacillus saccharophilus TaxID=361277 RepID=UPI003D2B03D1
MALQALLETIEKLHKLHRSLLEISKLKSDHLKANDMDGLQKQLLAEKKHVQAVAQLEKLRIKQTEAYAVASGLPVPATVSELLEQIANQKLALQFEQELIGLTETVTELKKQEALNQQLLEQSMQFLQISLDMLAPSIQSLNYGTPNQDQQRPQNRTLFDSKA